MAVFSCCCRGCDGSVVDGVDSSLHCEQIMSRDDREGGASSLVAAARECLFSFAFAGDNNMPSGKKSTTEALPSSG